MFMTYLVCINDINSFASAGHIADDTLPKRYSNRLMFIHIC